MGAFGHKMDAMDGREGVAREGGRGVLFRELAFAFGGPGEIRYIRK